MRTYVFVLRIVDAIEARLPQKLDVAMLADDLNVSKWYLQHEFKSHTGMTVGQYYRARQLSLAAYTIATTSQRLMDIALDHGFESQEAFQRAFKKQFYRSPKLFRNAPQIAVYLSFPVLTESYLKLVTHFKTHSPQETLMPAMQLHGVAQAFDVLPYENIVNNATILWDTFIEAIRDWRYEPRSYYRVDYLTNGHLMGKLWSMASCTGTREPSPLPITTLDIPEQVWWRFEAPECGFGREFFAYFYCVFLVEKGLYPSHSLSLSLHEPYRVVSYYVELSRQDALPKSVTSLATSSSPRAISRGELTPMHHIPSEYILRAERLTYLLEHYAQALDAVNRGEAAFMIGATGEEDYEHEHDNQVQCLYFDRLGQDSVPASEVLRCQFFGTLEQIGHDLDILYHSYLGTTRYCLVSGYEWITRAQKQDEQHWSIELLIPVCRR